MTMLTRRGVISAAGAVTAATTSGCSSTTIQKPLGDYTASFVNDDDGQLLESIEVVAVNRLLVGVHPEIRVVVTIGNNACIGTLQIPDSSRWAGSTEDIGRTKVFDCANFRVPFSMHESGKYPLVATAIVDDRQIIEFRDFVLRYHRPGGRD